MGNAIKLLGAQHFKIEVIATTDSLFEAYYVLEPNYIGVYQSIERGYNGQLRKARPLFYHTLEKAFSEIVRREARNRNKKKPDRDDNAKLDVAMSIIKQGIMEWDREM